MLSKCLNISNFPCGPLDCFTYTPRFSPAMCFGTRADVSSTDVSAPRKPPNCRFMKSNNPRQTLSLKKTFFCFSLNFILWKGWNFKFKLEALKFRTSSEGEFSLLVFQAGIYSQLSTMFFTTYSYDVDPLRSIFQDKEYKSSELHTFYN